MTGVATIRPRKSACPPGQEFCLDRAGRRFPIHTPALKGRCRCTSCNQRRAWMPERKRRHDAQLRAYWAAHREDRRGRPAKPRGTDWKPEQDDALRALVGTMDLPSIAEELNRRFKTSRTESAVQHRIFKLGMSRWDRRPLSRSDAARMLGVSTETVRAWVGAGLLDTIPWRLAGRHQGRLTPLILPAAIETFVRAHVHLLRVERIRDRRLRDLAISVTRGRRPLTPPAMARLAGVKVDTLRTWLRAGRFPSAVLGPNRQWRILSTDLPLVQAYAAVLAAGGRNYAR